MSAPARSPTGAIQDALYQRLSEDPDLGADVYDDVPEGAEGPYVDIGEAIETPAGSHDRYGRETTVTLHVWDRALRFGGVTDIGDRITELLDHQPLPLAGPWRTISVRHEFAQTLRDPNPRWRHLIMRFRITTEQEK